MTLNDYKKEIEMLDSRLTETILKPILNWDIKDGMFGSDGLAPEERKEKAIKSLQDLRKTAFANAGELALYGQTDNLGIG